MNSKSIKYLAVFFLLIIFALLSTSTTLANQSEIPDSSNLYQQSQVIAFQDLGLEDFVMFGPFSTDQFEFGVPSNWQYTTSGELVLKFRPQFLGADVPLFTASGNGYIALLRVFYNDNRIYEVGVDLQPENEISIPIPVDILNSPQNDGRHKIEFSFLSELSCDYDILSSLIIDKTSYIKLDYELNPPQLDLRNFPRPIYQRDSIVSDPVAIVIPDNPSTEELQAIMTVSAGLGSLTRGNIPFDMFSFSELSQDVVAQYHMVVVGTSASVSSLNPMGFNLPVSGSSITLPSYSQDDGVLALSYSPWDATKAVLYVGGESPIGVLKASQALGTSALFVFDDPSYTLIDEVDPYAGESTYPVTRTLKDLGYSSSIRSGPNYVSGVGTRFLNYDLFVSPNQINAEDGSFTVKYTHSGTMQLGISAMTVLFNNTPIGSVPLTEETSVGNVVTFPIPNEYLHIGSNRLEIRADLIPETQCHIDVASNLWFSVDDSSTIHLPVADLTAPADNRIFDLQAFPQTMLQDPSLGNMLLVVPDNDLNAWKSASKLFTKIGDTARAPIFRPNVVTSNEVNEDMLKNWDVVMVGLPNNLPLIETLNEYSSVRFDTSTNQALLDGFRVLYRTPLEADLGYIQLLVSPWNQNRVIVSFLGNSEPGLTTTVNAFVDPEIRKNIVGNVSLTTKDAAISADTRIGQSSSDLLPTVVPTYIVETPVPTPVVPTDFTTNGGFEKPAWLIPVLLVNLGLIIIIVVAVLVVTSRKK